MESTVRIKEEVKEEPRDDMETEIRDEHCDQLLIGKEEMLPEMETKTCIKEEGDQTLMKRVKKESLDEIEMEMDEQFFQTKEEPLSDDEESLSTFASAHQNEQLAGNVSSPAFPFLDDDSDRMPSDWFCGESRDSEEAMVDEPVGIKAEPLAEDEESSSPFASPQPASPSIVIKGETCPCSGDCLDCLPKRSPPCPECGKTFASNAHLKRHSIVHTGERPFVCAQCPKAFTQLCSLTRHQLTHQAVRSKPFKCTAEGCGKAFPKKGELTVHFRSHTGDKPYRCDNCGKAFTQSGQLTLHLRLHTGERPYKCDICGKAFTQSGTLTVHFRTHTGERPYKCPLCPKAFADLSNAKYHQRTAHEQGRDVHPTEP